jgi:glycosyltransferase involved in cell wall biosynthesis
MRIVLDMEKTSRLQTGLGMFCLHLGKNLLVNAGPDLEFGFYLPDKQLKIFGDNALVFPQSPIHKFIFPSTIKTDVWHCSHQDSPYFPSDGTPLLLTIHDLNFMSRYSGYRREWRKRKLGRMLDRARALVCISEQTGRHLEEVYGLSSADYSVIYNGNCLSTFPGIEKSRFQRDRPFLLCIGVLSARKNAHVLCAMLANLPEFDLILAGPAHGDYIKKIVDEAQKWGIKERLIFAGEVNDEDKFRLFQNMEGLLFPSLAEGFGLPVVEAMSLGKPVFLSRSGSLPEIGGEVAFYWNDFEPGSMAELVLKGLEIHQNERASEKLKARAARFSWSKTALDYIQVYKDLV